MKQPKKFLKDNCLHIIVYSILIGGFLILIITQNILSEDVSSNYRALSIISKTINVFTFINLLFIPHRIIADIKKISTKVKEKKENKKKSKETKKSVTER